MNTGSNWSGMLAKDLRFVFESNYKDFPPIPIFEYAKPEPFWNNHIRTLIEWLGEWRGVVRR